jgi:hypothetical protein
MSFPLLDQLRAEPERPNDAGWRRAVHANQLVLADQIDALYEALEAAIDLARWLPPGKVRDAEIARLRSVLGSVRVALGGEA